MIPHHVIAPLIGLGALVVIALVVRIVIGDPRAARHLTRLLRWRTRLYLRPGPSYANMLELAVRWSGSARSESAAGPGHRCRGGCG